jgi:hypothetical protein
MMHLSDDELVLHYYGEMNEAAEARACAHLHGCDGCRERLAHLEGVMAVVDTEPVPEPSAGFEQRTWERLEPALVEPSASQGRDPRATVWNLWWPALRWAAATAVLVLAAYAAGRFWPAAPEPAAPGEPVRERILLVDLGDHLDRSELALVEFVSADGPDVARARARAEALAADNRLYRRAAIATGDRAVADVLDELERVLIEMAGTAAAASPDDRDAVRRRIDSRGLLFKVRVMRSHLQDRARGMQPPKGRDQTS